MQVHIHIHTERRKGEKAKRQKGEKAKGTRTKLKSLV